MTTVCSQTNKISFYPRHRKIVWRLFRQSSGQVYRGIILLNLLATFSLEGQLSLLSASLPPLRCCPVVATSVLGPGRSLFFPSLSILCWVPVTIHLPLLFTLLCPFWSLHSGASPWVQSCQPWDCSYLVGHPSAHTPSIWAVSAGDSEWIPGLNQMEPGF